MESDNKNCLLSLVIARHEEQRDVSIINYTCSQMEEAQKALKIIKNKILTYRTRYWKYDKQIEKKIGDDGDGNVGGEMVVDDFAMWLHQKMKSH